MTAITDPDAPLVFALTVLYEDEPDGGVIAHLPQVLGAISRGSDRDRARAAVRGVLADLIRGHLEPIDPLERLLDERPVRVVIEA